MGVSTVTVSKNGLRSCLEPLQSKCQTMFRYTGNMVSLPIKIWIFQGDKGFWGNTGVSMDERIALIRWGYSYEMPTKHG
jgi:hypothetical protein